MKRIYKLALAISAAVVTIGCEVVDISEHSDMADVSWYLSSNNDNYDPIQLSMNKHISFMDLSQGEVSHKWIVPEDAGIKFIDGDMGYSDVDYESMVVASDYITPKKTIHLYFTQAGEFDITLVDTFNKAVSYTYIDKDGERQSVSSTLENGVHTIRKVFTVKVFASKIEPSARVYLDADHTQEVEVGYDDDQTTLRSVEIEYGDTLYFVDDSYDMPNSWIWNCVDAGYSNVEGETTEMQFKTLSNGKPFKISQTVERKFVSGYTPTAAAVTKTLDLEIYVVANTDPLIIEQPKQVGHNTIEIALANGEFDASTLEGAASKFQLVYVNGSLSGSIPISSVEVKDDAPSTLVLTLAEQIYNTDTLTLSYTGDEIGVKYNANKFEIATDNQSVKTTYAEVFNSDFEDEVIGAVAKDWLVTVDNTGTFDDKAVTDVLIAQEDGNNYITTDLSDETLYDSTHTPRLTFRDPFDGIGGVGYTLRFKYRVSNKKSGFNAIFIKAPYTNTNSVWFSSPWISIGNANQWIKFERAALKGAVDIEDVMFMLRVNVWSGVLDVDDISFSNAEIRPTN